jgi:hypothetical protein
MLILETGITVTSPTLIGSPTTLWALEINWILSSNV